MLKLINLILVSSVLGTLGKMKFTEVAMVIKIDLIAFFIYILLNYCDNTLK